MEEKESNNNNKEEEISINSEDENQKYKDIIDILQYKNNNIIIFKSTNNKIKINSKSLKVIFSLIEEKEKPIEMYLNHIIINILDNNKNCEFDKKINNKINNNEEQKNNLEVLDIKYKTLLKKTLIYFVNVEDNKKNEINLNKNKKITLMKKSLAKIFKYLNESIISMYDYINLAILYLKDENQSNFAKLLIEQKILGKYHRNSKINDFTGKKNYNCTLNLPIKNESQNIYSYDNLFNKVLDYIDDYEKESSFSDNINNFIIPRKNIDEDLIQNSKVYFVEEGILIDINSNQTNTQNKEKNNNNNQNICHNTICNEMCFVF